MGVQTRELIEDLRSASGLEMQGSRSKLGADTKTLLRVLCHKSDSEASQFLKKQYKIPKSSSVAQARSLSHLIKITIKPNVLTICTCTVLYILLPSLSLRVEKIVMLWTVIGLTSCLFFCVISTYKFHHELCSFVQVLQKGFGG